MLGETNPNAISFSPSPDQDLPGFFIMDIHADPFQDFKAAEMDSVTFLLPHSSISSTGHFCGICCYHVSPFLIFIDFFLLLGVR
jgi:hypothetical protein